MNVGNRVPNPTDVAVGARLRKRRKECGISQTTLATELKISFQQIQKYEKGTNRVGASRLATIAQGSECGVVEVSGTLQVIAANHDVSERASSPIGCFCQCAPSRPTLEFPQISRRRCTECFLEHRNERGNGFIPEVTRNLLHRRPGRKASDSNNQLQLLSPTAEGQAGFLLNETGKGVLTHCHSLGPLCHGASVGGVLHQGRRDTIQSCLGS